MTPLTRTAVELSRALSPLGSARSHAERIGVSNATVSRYLSGDGLPDKDTLDKLIQQLPAEIRARIGIAFLEDMRPSSVEMVRIGIGPDNPDRLERAIMLLPGYIRDALAAYVEAINKAPDLGYPALQSMAALLTRTGAGTGLNEATSAPAASAPTQGVTSYQTAAKAHRKAKKAGEGEV